MGRRAYIAAASLLALAACGSPAADDNAAAPVAAPEQAAAPVAEPPAAAPATATPVTARRCGWLHNPTPGNWWLTDREGEWILATQGGRQVEGLDEIPDMSLHEWEETNVHYGYGCACVSVTTAPASAEVVRISDVEPKPLKQCRADKALPSP